MEGYAERRRVNAYLRDGVNASRGSLLSFAQRETFNLSQLDFV